LKRERRNKYSQTTLKEIFYSAKNLLTFLSNCPNKDLS
jgi:hypothetical protein